MSAAASPLLYDAYGNAIYRVELSPRVWLERPLDGLSFDYISSVALPAVGVSAAVVDFTVEPSFNGIIDRISNVFIGAGFADFSGALQWQLLIDTVAVPFYDNILASLGATASPSLISGVPIKAGQRVQLMINNIALAVGGASSGGRLGGWFYPVEEEPEGGPS